MIRIKIRNRKDLKIRDFLIGLGVTLILLGCGGFWDLAVIKQDWRMYPFPFELFSLPRCKAADLFFALVVCGMSILLLIGRDGYE